GEWRWSAASAPAGTATAGGRRTRDEGAPFARRVQHALFGGPGGAVWLAGGQGPGWRALNDLWRLGAEARGRGAMASAWKPRFDFGAAELGDGRMLVTGGGSGQQ
ncbi:unnamed protein product, partial [Prorocentrum cordatum]